MKIRNGFVSNSSSSSFIVKGFVVESYKLDDKKLVDNIFTAFPEIKQKVDKYIEGYKNLGIDDYEVQREVYYGLMDLDIYYADCMEDGAPKNCTIFGTLLEDTGEAEYIHDMVIDCTLDEKLESLQSLLKNSLKTDDDLSVKIVCGTRSC